MFRPFDNSAVSFVPESLASIRHMLKEAIVTNARLPSDSAYIECSTSTVIRQLQSLNTFLRHPADVQFPATNYGTAGQYILYLKQLYNVLEMLSSRFSDSYAQLALSIGQRPITTTTTPSASLSSFTNSGLAQEMLNKINQTSGVSALSTPMDLAMERISRKHKKALCFVESLLTDPIKPDYVYNSLPTLLDAGSQNVPRLSIHTPSPALTNPYSGWAPNSPYSVGGNLAKTEWVVSPFEIIFLGHTDLSGFDVVVPRQCSAMLDLYFESDVSGVIRFTLTTSYGDSQHYVELDSDSDIFTKRYVLPFPDRSGTYTVSSFSAPGNVRMLCRMTTGYVSRSTLTWISETGGLNPVNGGVTFLDLYGIRGRNATDSLLAPRSAVSSYLMEVSGFKSTKIILSVFAEAYCGSRSWPDTTTGVVLDYVDPTNWDRFLAPGSDGRLGINTILTMAWNDISASMGLAYTDSNYLRALSSRI